MLFFMHWIRFTNRLFGARIQINEPDRVQFETNEPIDLWATTNLTEEVAVGERIAYWIRTPQVPGSRPGRYGTFY